MPLAEATAAAALLFATANKIFNCDDTLCGANDKADWAKKKIRGRGVLDHAVIGQGTRRQLIWRQDLDEGA